MKYEAVYLYNNRNEFLGVSIKGIESDRLQTINIWSENEIDDFKKALAGLNDEHALRQFWPDANDEEVGNLVDNPEWEPLELREELVPDWDASTVVTVLAPSLGYDYDAANDVLRPVPEPDTGKVLWHDTGEIDNEKSNIVYKKAMVPDPSEAQARYYKAQEIVARQRYVLASASNA